jgi:hypothetical protein
VGGSSTGIDVVNSGLLTNSAINNLGASYGGVLSFDDSAGSTSTIDNEGAITGQGYVIQSRSDIMDISNSGTVHGGLFSLDFVSLDNTGTWLAGTDASGVGTDGLLLRDGGTLTNSGNIHAAISLTGSTNNSLINSGNITGNVTLSGISSTMKNHHEIYGDVTLGNSDALINTGIIHGDVNLGAGDTVNDSRGEITGAINASANDLFVYNGHFGQETINNFVAAGVTNDVIQFGANNFGSFGAVMSSTKQVGTDSVISN